MVKFNVLIKATTWMLLSLCFVHFATAQDHRINPNKIENNAQPEWVLEMYSPNPDPGKVIRLYEAYYAVNPFVKNMDTQNFKRFLRGIAREQKRTPEEDRTYLLNRKNASSSRYINADWTCIGPRDWDHSAAGRSYAPGAAHVYTVEQSISNPNTIYAGTATAGIWKSTNRGDNWVSLTTDLLHTEVYAIEIAPNNADVMYAGYQNSIYKTTNGGTTFTQTGDNAFKAISHQAKDIRINAANANKVFACTSQGLFVSTNGGTGWTRVVTGDFLEVEFHPGNANIIYAVRKNVLQTDFLRSTDGGTSFSIIGNNWPVPPVGGDQERTEISVSPAAPNHVFAHCSGEGNGGSGLYGVYVSTDQGLNWTFRCCGPQPAGPPSLSNPNLMAWSDDGTDDGGQYYYDMGFAVSPTNADSIWLAGVNVWVSGNQGVSFTCPAKWSHPHKPNYVHADIHDIHYYPHTQELWIAGDGGIFRSTDNGASFTRKNLGIEGTDFWGFGQGWWYGDIMLGGAYHNGTMLKEENVYTNGWICTDGGDGTLGFVNPGIEKQVYSWFDIKTLKSDRTIAPITRTFNNMPNNSYIIGKSSDLLIDPRYYTHWLTGSGTRLYKTTDNGFSYRQIYNFSEDIAAMDQCWSAPNVIYAATFKDWWAVKKIFRSDNSGSTWTEITPTSAMVNGNMWIPYDIAVDHNDPMKVWITRTSMYDSNTNGFSVYYSSNGGATWQNISGSGLNGQSPTSIFLQKGSDNGIYLGTRKGVYYKDNSLSTWILYSSGLPAITPATRLEGWYRKQKIRNATSRSVWESDFYQPSQPVAYPSMSTDTIFCTRDTAYFVDHSVVSDVGNTWSWSFPGGMPSTSTLRNPKVNYDTPGSYDVTLTVTDVNGSNTKTMENMVKVANFCTLDTIPGKALLASGTNKHGVVNNFNMNATNTMTVTAWIRPTGTQPDYSAIFMSDGPNAAGLNFKGTNNSLGYHWPGGSWSWNSGLTLPANQWSFVALVVQPTGITIYANDQKAIHNATLTVTDIPAFRVGNYRGWESRNMNGQIDEVAIYDRALTQAEIRDHRHLVKQNITGLRAYYQFNSNTNNDFDKVNSYHINLVGGATKTASEAPIGAGVSQRINVASGGLKNFNNADVRIHFPNTGTFPNGEIVVTKINQLPITKPDTRFLPKNYWIINNYGANQTFTVLDSIKFYNSGNISGGCDAFHYNFHKRTANGFGATWGSTVDDGDGFNPNPPAYVKFSSGNSTTSFGQFILVRNNGVPNPNAIEFCNGIDDDCDGLIDESYPLSVTSSIDGEIGSLRNILICAQDLDTIDVAGNIDTIFLNTPLAIAKKIVLRDKIGNRVTIKANLNAAGFINATAAIQTNSVQGITFDNINIKQNANSLDKPVVRNQGILYLKNCQIEGNPEAVLINEGGGSCNIIGTTVIK